MSRQNRVNPFGELVATPEKGTLMGNRGCLHDCKGVIRKAFARRAWVTCRLQWKDIQRSVFTPDRYSELFFMDEATAFAAGHRPCNDCRKEAYQTFVALFSEVVGAGSRLKADEMDKRIHADRLTEDRRQRTHFAKISSLPDGVIVLNPSQPKIPCLLWRGRLWRWSFGGYSEPIGASDLDVAEVLTPSLICAVFAAGYPVTVHPSAYA